MRASILRPREATVKVAVIRGMLVVSALSVTLSCAAFLLYGSWDARRELIDHTASVAEMLAYSVRGAVAFGDRALADRLLAASGTDEEVVRVVVLDTDGALFASYPAAQPQGAGEPIAAPRMVPRACRVQSSPVLVDGETLGHVQVTYSLRGLYTTFERHVLKILLVLGVCIVFASVLAHRLQRRITEPLLSLADWVKNLTASQDLNQRASRATDDEIGTVVDGLNELLAQINLRDASLQENERRLQEHRCRLRSLTFQLEAASEAERRDLAADLHDSVCQLLWGAKLRLSALLQDTRGTPMQELTGQVTDLVQRSLNEARALTFQLCPRHLYDLGLESALQHVPETLPDMGALRYTCESQGLPDDLEDVVSILVYRSVQELVRNVIKHARASCVSVVASAVADQLCVSVSDDGIGLKPEEALKPEASTRGFGLFSIMERLRALGGCLEVQAVTPRGSRFTIWIPYHHSDVTHKTGLSRASSQPERWPDAMCRQQGCGEKRAREATGGVRARRSGG